MGKAEPAPTTGPPPLTIIVAMFIAIAGSAWSAAFSLKVIRGLAPPSDTLLYAMPGLSLIALNILFLFGMWHRSKWAWRAAYGLVVIGSFADFLIFVYPFMLIDPTWEFLYFGRLLAPRSEDSTIHVIIGTSAHLALIQAPILILLLLKPSRQWVGLPPS